MTLSTPPQTAQAMPRHGSLAMATWTPNGIGTNDRQGLGGGGTPVKPKWFFRLDCPVAIIDSGVAVLTEPERSIMISGLRRGNERGPQAVKAESLR